MSKQTTFLRVTNTLSDIYTHTHTYAFTSIQNPKNLPQVTTAKMERQNYKLL